MLACVMAPLWTLTCGMPLDVFPGGDCRLVFCPLMGMVHMLSVASGHVFCLITSFPSVMCFTALS